MVEKIEVVLSGFRDQDEQSLKRALERKQAGLFQFATAPLKSGGRLDYSLPKALKPSPLLLGERAVPVGMSLREAPRFFRAEMLIWEPIHLFVDRPPSPVQDLFTDWGVRVHRLPPVDLDECIGQIIGDGLIATKQQRTLLACFLEALADDLAALHRSVSHSSSVDGARVGEALYKVAAGLAEYGKDYAGLREELNSLLTAPLLDSLQLPLEVLERLHTKLISAEAAACDLGASDRLRFAIHAAKNTVSLARSPFEMPRDVAARANKRLDILGHADKRALSEKLTDDLLTACSDVAAIVTAFEHENSLECDAVEGLPVKTGTLRLAARAIARPVESNSDRIPQRIVVVEDDPYWRSVIVGILLSMGLPVPIQEAASVREAEFLLDNSKGVTDTATRALHDDKAAADLAQSLGLGFGFSTNEDIVKLASARRFSSGPALVLVDLGLPHERSNEHSSRLDAGLHIMRAFSGTNRHGQPFPYRFAVLTAAENYADAVHQASQFGVSPWRYLHKGYPGWESDLRNMVRATFTAGQTRPLIIELLSETNCIARLAGYEIKLDRIEWHILACFAENRRWNAERLLERLSFYPHHIDLEGDPDEPNESAGAGIRRLQGHLSDLRLRLTHAYRRSQAVVPPHFLKEHDGYYELRANVRMLEPDKYAQTTRRQPTVLIIEDNASWGTEISNVLQDNGFEVCRARHSDAAMKQIDSEPPDLVSLDMEIPANENELEKGCASTAHAIEFLHKLRQIHPEIPVVVLTAIATRDRDMLTVLRQGVRYQDYLSKSDPNWRKQIGNALLRCWLETTNHTSILDWGMDGTLFPITLDPLTGFLCKVAGYPIKIRPASKKGKALALLCATPNVIVSKDRLKDAVWEDVDTEPNDPDGTLTQLIAELQRDITHATGGRVVGEAILSRRTHCLRGVVQWDGGGNVEGRSAG